MRAAAEVASRLGYHVAVQPAPTTGNARHAASALLDTARRLGRPACLIASGETTVRVVGSGKGGRNQEFALAALESLADLRPAVLASLGTDGIDGPTDAAGAIVDGDMWAALGPDAAAEVGHAFADNNSYPVLDRLGALVRSGPSGTNVGDFQVLLLDS
jgi:glycerate 2-kinase